MVGPASPPGLDSIPGTLRLSLSVASDNAILGEPELSDSSEGADLRIAALTTIALIVSGTFPALVAPPLGWVFLHPFCWIPAFWLFGRLPGGHAFLAGWLVGALETACIFYWIPQTIHRYSNLPDWIGLLALFAFVLVFGLHVGVFAWGFRTVRRVAGGWWPFAIAAWFTACEFVNPQLFPFYQGVGWYEFPSLFLIVSLTGVAGATYLVMLTNGLALQGLELAWTRAARNAPRAPLWNVVIGTTLLLGAYAWSMVRLDRIATAEGAAQPLRVALVQPNWDVERRRELLRSRRDALALRLVAASRRALEADPTLQVLVWPEQALGAPLRHPANRVVRDFVRRSRTEVWTGGIHAERREGGRVRARNSAYRVHAGGSVDRRYDKNVLLPFGEFMPFAETFPILREIEGPGDLLPGTELTVYQAGRTRFAFLICYEAILSGYVRQAIEDEVNLLVNLTHDAWFGDSSAPHQHLMLTAVQAALYGVPLLRATTTGITAIVDARGLVVRRSGLFTEEVIVEDVKPLRIGSPYAALGDWFAWGCVAASLGLLGLAWRG